MTRRQAETWRVLLMSLGFTLTDAGTRMGLRFVRLDKGRLVVVIQGTNRPTARDFTVTLRGLDRQ